MPIPLFHGFCALFVVLALTVGVAAEGPAAEMGTKMDAAGAMAGGDGCALDDSAMSSKACKALCSATAAVLGGGNTSLAVTASERFAALAGLSMPERHCAPDPHPPKSAILS